MSFNMKRKTTVTKKMRDEESKPQVSHATKRHAETSPGESSKPKRAVLGDLTNAISSNVNQESKKEVKGKGKRSKKVIAVSKDVATTSKNSSEETAIKSSQESLVESSKSEISQKEPLVEEKAKVAATKRSKRVNAGATTSKNNLEETVKSSQESFVSCKSEISQTQIDESNKEKAQETSSVESPTPILPPGVVDFDGETANEQYSEPNFAMDIFRYYKEREALFRLDDYLARQTEVSKGMRSILVDWMVEVQESFELNHETLYLGVKLVDHYLCKHIVSKSSLQLLGATAVFISCKFDERCPPLIDDFLYICDDAYSRKELIAMETNILKTMDFDIGIPLSYRFLRRYARCAKVSMEILTLARFVLEMSLMDYDFVQISDSKMAAASLLLAIKMKHNTNWTPTLEYYSSYKAEDLTELMFRLNCIISAPSQRNLQTVRTKYSHKVFFEVAKIPPLQPQAT